MNRLLKIGAMMLILTCIIAPSCYMVSTIYKWHLKKQVVVPKVEKPKGRPELCSDKEGAEWRECMGVGHR